MGGFVSHKCRDSTSKLDLLHLRFCPVQICSRSQMTEVGGFASAGVGTGGAAAVPGAATSFARLNFDYSSFNLQALDWERVGPIGTQPSPERRRRLAVQEGATALVATLLPAIEPVRLLCVRGSAMSCREDMPATCRRHSAGGCQPLPGVLVLHLQNERLSLLSKCSMQRHPTQTVTADLCPTSIPGRETDDLTPVLQNNVLQVQKVTIASYQKLPLGHMVLALNEGRELAGFFTRRYLLEQLRLVLAGGF